MSLSPNTLSEQLLLAVKMEKPAREYINNLSEIDLLGLQQALKDDTHKKAFWINVYNAFFQLLRKVDKIEKSKIYKVKKIKIAQQQFSLDDIEHGILRKYRFKFSLGYVPDFFASSLVKSLAVSVIDFRIHFALNCGAKSCPPIAFYSPNNLEQQLEMATRNFLESETTIIKDKNEIHITRLFQWFKGDFGGTSGIRKILDAYLNTKSKSYKLIYKKYLWEENLNNYV